MIRDVETKAHQVKGQALHRHKMQSIQGSKAVSIVPNFWNLSKTLVLIGVYLSLVRNSSNYKNYYIYISICFPNTFGGNKNMLTYLKRKI